MSFLKKIGQKLRKSIKFSASDPSSFEEIWSFNSTRIQFISLVLILFSGVGILFIYVFGGIVHGNSGSSDVSIERDQLEEQYQQMEELSREVENQDRYIAGLQKILNGEVPVDVNLDSLIQSDDFESTPVQSDPTKAEEQLAKKVKDDMRTPQSKSSSIPYFTVPVKGVISESFDVRNHPGVDIVTAKGQTVKACLSGTVIYSGYTRKDGYVLIIDHANGYLSVYKHNKTVFKKMGAKVQLGDPIAVVGNTGENTDGPHLHFELWYDQGPINPEEYFDFKR